MNEGTMDKRIKNALGVSAVVALIAVAYAVVGYAGSFARQTDFSSPAFSVSGEGKVVAIPDVAGFSFSVVTEGGRDISSLQDENAKKMNGIIEFIKSKGVKSKDIKTTGYIIQPRYQYYKCSTPDYRKPGVEPCPPKEIVGYTVRQSARVKVRDFGEAGVILSGVGERGANSVSGLSFSVDDKIKFENEARAKAIKQAEEKAKSIARAAGFRLGRLISINENKEGYYAPRRYASLETQGASSSGTPVNIEPGSQDIISAVTLRYQIK